MNISELLSDRGNFCGNGLKIPLEFLVSVSKISKGSLYDI